MLVTGRGLVEAPRWHEGRLYFSDWTAGEVLAVDAAGHTEVVARVRSLPLCSAWLPDGRLLIVSSADGRLLRREPDGSLQTHAELGGPGWNDIVVDGRGNAYVNSVGFDMMAGEAPRPGHVVLATPDGTVRRVAEDLAGATTARFSAGDMMPSTLQRAWWDAMLELVKDPEQLDAVLDRLTAVAADAP